MPGLREISELLIGVAQQLVHPVAFRRGQPLEGLQADFHRFEMVPCLRQLHRPIELLLRIQRLRRHHGRQGHETDNEPTQKPMVLHYSLPVPATSCSRP